MNISEKNPPCWLIFPSKRQLDWKLPLRSQAWSIGCRSPRHVLPIAKKGGGEVISLRRASARSLAVAGFRGVLRLQSLVGLGSRRPPLRLNEDFRSSSFDVFSYWPFIVYWCWVAVAGDDGSCACKHTHRRTQEGEMEGKVRQDVRDKICRYIFSLRHPFLSCVFLLHHVC